jgi:integrase
MPLFAKRYRMKATMSDAEIEAFIALPAPKVRGLNKAHYFLWTLFFSLMAYTGMRPGEVAGLSVNDVDFGRGVFVLKDTKTNEPRTVPIPVNVLPALQDRLKNCQGILFPGVDNTDWHYNFHTRVKRLGIVRDNLTPYSLRHSFITTLLSEGSDLFATQHIVGHHDIRTTAHYYHLDLKAMKRAQEKHPIIRKETSPNNILQAIRESIKSFGLEHDGRFKFYLSESNLTLKMEISII